MMPSDVHRPHRRECGLTLEIDARGHAGAKLTRSALESGMETDGLGPLIPIRRDRRSLDRHNTSLR